MTNKTASDETKGIVIDLREKAIDLLMTTIKGDIADLKGTKDRMPIVATAYVSAMGTVAGYLIGAAPATDLKIELIGLLTDELNGSIDRAENMASKFDEVRALLNKILAAKP